VIVRAISFSSLASRGASLETKAKGEGKIGIWRHRARYVVFDGATAKFRMRTYRSLSPLFRVYALKEAQS
jgi:hypothetical protein